jgi:3,4-dihydroxy-9,10-secoandrosta-1,3,5(10)-triene-9,17-dione 4,5-dioxygenase
MRCRGLGYVGIDSTDTGAWETFLADVCGMQPAPPDDDGTLRLRMDRRTWRVAVHPSDRDGCAYVGWEYADPTDLEEACARVAETGTAVKRLGDEEALARKVKGLARFEDPWGNVNEMYFGQAMSEEPFLSPVGVSGFLTDGVGLGHALYVVPDAWEAATWYLNALDFSLTDFFTWGSNSAIFLHTTRRHHSLAFVDLPLPGGQGLNHFMIESDRIDDTGAAYDRARAANVTITNSLGQHANDPMLSFYMQSPGGFNVEFGWDGLMLDPETWVATEWSGRGELWGHTGEFMDDIADAKQE